jgi:ABC-2 type transport system ATP-binding protein
MDLITVSNLSKHYKTNVKKKGFFNSVKNILIPEYKIIPAVENISFSIKKGEMVGFIGPNGAGKSTTVKMLTGILVPTSGEISVNGICPHKDRKKNAQKLGIVFGQRTQLWWDLPVYETFNLLRVIYKIPKEVYDKNLKLFNQMLGLDEFFSRPVRQLSLGQRMRADIAASALHNPEIILYDEPTIGLDVVAKENIRNFIKQLNKDTGITMLFTTHDMQDIEKTCNRMIIIDKGTILYDGTVNQIKQKYGNICTLIVDFDKENLEIKLPGIKILKEEKNKKWFYIDRKTSNISSIIAELTDKYNLIDLTIQETEIEEIIRNIYKGDIQIDKN